MVNAAINDLDLRAEKGLYSILAINSWVKKYHPLYHLLLGLHKKMYLETIGQSEIRLPPMDLEPSEEMGLLEVYEKLNSLVQLHQREGYFKTQNELFEIIKGDTVQEQKWLDKNRSIYDADYVTFIIDYLDYDLNNQEHHLMVFISNFKRTEIYVNREDFTNSIRFVERYL